MAPLRERREDIPLLAAHFLDHACQRLHLRRPRLTRDHVRELQQYDWPGNIRELENVIERAVLLSRGGALDVEGVLGERGTAPRRGASATGSEAAPALVPDIEWRRRERENLRMALQLANGRVYGVDGAAERLGVKPTTLVSRLKALGLRKPRARAAPSQAGKDAAR